MCGVKSPARRTWVEMYEAKPSAGKLPITVLNHHGSGYFCEFKRTRFHFSKIQGLRMIL
ncbi:hypothetical protein Hanom_Chr14g01252011 [Helianthus anomalus]